MPAFSLGKGERSKLGTCYTPGPGAYDNNTKNNREPGYSITRTILNSSKDRIAEYSEIADQTRKTAKSLLATRYVSPGPANYNISTKEKPKKLNQWKMGMRPKPPNTAFLIPGPGGYNLKEPKSSTSFSFGYRFSNGDNSLANKVGPGAYHIESSFTKYSKLVIS